MASFSDERRAAPGSACAGPVPLLADSYKCAARSNAAVDAAAAAYLELATLQRSNPTSALPRVEVHA